MTVKKPRRGVFTTRAQAIERAIDTGTPWEEITIHDQKCVDIGEVVGCVCDPVVIVIKGDEKQHRIGFRPPNG